jgi:hypothetical protein
MSYLGIPLEVLESPAYLALSDANQRFLLDLYVTFADCECFTICMDKPEQYRQPKGATLQRKVTALINAGFLRVERFTGHQSNPKRVFAFVNKPLEIAEAA